MTPAGDLAVVRRAGLIIAIQASAALALVLLVVGGVVFTVYVRTQNRQIDAELQTLAMSADDANDPPPDMELALRDNNGHVSTSDGGQPGVPLLSGPTGFGDLRADGRHYRTLAVDRPEGRVVAMMDLAPNYAGRNRLLIAVAFAELAGIVASVAVVAMFTRRSVRPLAQALALQRRFVADASHELRAPLTVLHTRAQMLAHRADDADVQKVREEAEALVADTRALSDIVDDLLASATMTAGKPPRDRVDLAEVVATVRDSMAPYADALGVMLRLKEPSSATSFAVTGSRAALRRALTALVDNALGHEHRGGTVEMRLRRIGSAVSVEVADDGVGIDAESMATLFTRFAHGTEHTTRTGRESYGIGLALVREIAQAHGGEVTATSTPGQGATFALTVPAAQRV
ncbi:HAMP domain-containing sensor histidine kinase [Mycobacterium sp. CVI_P3]|uniref:histidine kinase n=1 Tax=Mycobacterium pinniadriaticum TaxID=2994102 RepID=A0ABT3S7R9_9MYCO|nr:HAMP domain-containing sensor histidine kinase [Mycobacterium pinniadriaticum]MCX2929128.1 HAMP domain-containing sensor histidine kinase [Mycobacterium pinniadriaticum]MCX2935553.1 HAMP domain-containing sensor histidine kinase [Mycobacterium pinniadriaticum]